MPVAAEAERARIGSSNVQSAPRRTIAWIVVAMLLAAACAWILHLPLFPSQDGPAHVYYARVCRDLLSGAHTYGRDFRIARPFPPYSVHAYMLMGFLQVASGELAEELLACFSVLVCGIGLAYLARQLGRSAPLMAALSVPFLLNRWLFCGFYGYNIGTGVALLAIAVWLREDRRMPLRRAVFLLLTLLTLFSHPVPYLVIVGFCWTEALCGWWNRRQSSGNTAGVPIQAPSAADAVTLGVVSSLFLYVKRYSHSGMLWNNELLADAHDKLLRIVEVFRTRAELPLNVPAYNWILAAALVAVTVVACRLAIRESRARTISRLQLVVGWAILILIAMPFLPATMNGSGFFAARFSIWPPLLFFAAAAGTKLSQRLERVLLAGAIALLAFTLLILNAHILPIARQLDVSSVPRGSLAGEHLMWHTDSPVPSDLTYDPYILAPVRVVDRSAAVLSDSPWMDLQIMMLEETGPKVRFDRERGPVLISGTPAQVGMVSARCGVAGPGIAAGIAARHPDTWTLSKYACFEVLLPKR